jgi:hypothetical protein
VNCEQANNLLSAKVDGEIDPADLAALESHLTDCPACRAVEQALSAQDDELHRAFAPRRLAATALADRVLAQLDPPRVAQPPTENPFQNPSSSSFSGVSEGPLFSSETTSKRTAARSWWTSWGKPLTAAAAGFALAFLILRPWHTPQFAVNPPTTTHSAVQPVGQLSLATGAVFVCPSGSDQWRPLESGGAVQAGMRVRTGRDVRGEFKLADGSEVRLNTDTQVTLASPRRVDVTGGQIFSAVYHRPDNAPFVVGAAPAGATLTALGTAFDVSCQSGKATCTVVEGSVKVEGSGSQNVIKSGETLTVTDGRFGDKRQVENLMRATRWVNEILVLKGRDNPELARRIDDIFAQLGHDKMWYLAAEEVRNLGDHCVIPLTRYIQSDRSKINEGERMKRREAARIVGDVATTWAIPELINLLADDDGEVRYPAARALQRLTGQTLDRRPEEWRDQPLMTCAPSIDRWHTWWKQNQSNYPGADPNAVNPVEIVKQRLLPKEKG